MKTRSLLCLLNSGNTIPLALQRDIKLLIESEKAEARTRIATFPNSQVDRGVRDILNFAKVDQIHAIWFSTSGANLDDRWGFKREHRNHLDIGLPLHRL